MSKYPIFLELTGKRVVIIGGGEVAARKAQALYNCGAHIAIVAIQINPQLEKLCSQGNIELIASEYTRTCLTGATLIIAATDNHKLNEQVYNDCRKQGILCNVVDEPELCDFFVPAVVKQGPLQIAISTDGLCPAYAARIRKKLEKIFTAQYKQFLVELGKIRKQIISRIHDKQARKILLDELTDDDSFEFFTKQGPQAWQNRAAQKINELQ